MGKVVLITGASSGIGNETAKLFQSKNWYVAATMRNPDAAADLHGIVDLECIRLDVTDRDSIRTAIDRTIERFGRIDAVVNNAGYGLVGPFEAATDEQIRKQFETNVFGLMNVCREIIPYFREEKRGHIVNIASVGGRVTFPLYSVYHATKWAVEGFSESLHYELRPFGIKVKIIEPGPIKTDFHTRSQEVVTSSDIKAYDEFAARVIPNMNAANESAPDGRIVAETIFDAVSDRTNRIRYNVNTRGILLARRFLPEGAFYALIRKALAG